MEKNKFIIELNGNPEYATLHTSVKLTENKYSSSIQPLTRNEEIELESLCSGMDGVCEASIHKYSIVIKCGLAFDRVVLCNGVAELVRQWASITKGIGYDEWKFGPVKRSDIEQIQCKECSAAQDSYWKEILRDM
jgi:hypothetical protein